MAAGCPDRRRQCASNDPPSAKLQSCCSGVKGSVARGANASGTFCIGGIMVSVTKACMQLGALRAK